MGRSIDLRRLVPVWVVFVTVLAATVPAAGAVATTDDSVPTGVTPGAGADPGHRVASATVRADAQTAGIVTWTAPGTAFDDLATPADVADAAAAGSLTRTDRIAQGDVVVVAVRQSGVFGALDDRKNSGEDYETAFVDLVTADNGFSFGMERRAPTANRRPKTLDLVDTVADDGLHVIPDQDNGTLFLAFRTDRIDLDRMADEDLAIDPGETYRATFTVDESTRITDDTITLEADWRAVERTLAFDTIRGDRIPVRPERCQLVSGRSSVAPGTDISLRLRSTGDQPFLRTPSVELQPNRSFSASVDFTGIPTDTTFEVSARDFETTAPGIVTTIPAASVSIPDQRTDGRQVVVASASLPDGGFVAIHDGPVSRPVLGTSQYLEPGNVSNLTITLEEPLDRPRTLVAVPHTDGDGDQVFDEESADRPYQLDCDAVADSAIVRLGDATPTPTPTPMATPTPTPSFTPTPTPTPAPVAEPTPTPAPSPTAEPTPTATTGASGPGFTAALAVLALLSAALVLARHR